MNAATTAPAADQAEKISRRQQWRNESTVTLTEKGLKNPKKVGTASFERYQGYIGFKKRIADSSTNPPTVSELMKAGVRMDDIRHDFAHGFINLNQPFEL